ncbi:MAG: tetratricopeptide repeat protein [Acaryochloris sp. RU_4_1]|nr:tetratricopeptide repeat protein [Acaryochloris sp. RU_4_1]NJR56429.1 tetratricopeptide repeat protein [Acaryochloris sp. CRU_2_0]
MLALRYNGWPLFAILIINGLALSVPQITQAESNVHPLPSTLSNTALSREDRSQVFFTMGIQKALNGDYQNAIADYDQALKLVPSNSEAYYNRGVAYFSIGHPQIALQDFSRAIELQPTMAEAYGNRGMIRWQLGDQQGALADYQEAKDLFHQKGDLPAAQQMQHWINQQMDTP